MYTLLVSYPPGLLGEVLNQWEDCCLSGLVVLFPGFGMYSRLALEREQMLTGSYAKLPITAGC